MHIFDWSWASILFIADLTLRIGFSLRVIMRKREPSVSFAWLVLILLFPFAGVLLYLLFGENRLGERRAARMLRDRSLIREWSNILRVQPDVCWDQVNPECLPLARQVRAVTGIPALPGNHLELLDHSDLFFDRLTADIRHASSSCYLEFYILQPGGRIDGLIEALIAARRRGVDCRLLLDSIGSKAFLRGETAKRMRREGIQVLEALPAGLFRALFVRIDLRNHRKLALIDARLAYTGSQNLVDPRLFKQEDGVGEWVDAMLRISGPVVEALTVAFLVDWSREKEGGLYGQRGGMKIVPSTARGEALVQMAPSGPGYAEDGIRNLLLTTLYAARRELILTTPYFVPDNAMLAALKSAAERGVDVTIIVPEKNDSHLVYYASRAHYEPLTAAGVRIMTFTGGLLHTKTITVDGDFCLFGSVNLDMRSFWLNFEMTLFIYDQRCAARVRELQRRYLLQAREHDAEGFARRSFGQRFLENIALLIGPLL